jgi:hypothetical protein
MELLGLPTQLSVVENMAPREAGANVILKVIVNHLVLGLHGSDSFRVRL